MPSQHVLSKDRYCTRTVDLQYLYTRSLNPTFHSKPFSFYRSDTQSLQRPSGTDEEVPVFQHDKQKQYQTTTETMAQGWRLSEL